MQKCQSALDICENVYFSANVEGNFIFMESVSNVLVEY